MWTPVVFKISMISAVSSSDYDLLGENTSTTVMIIFSIYQKTKRHSPGSVTLWLAINYPYISSISFLTGLATPAGKLFIAMLVSLLCLNIYPLVHFSSTGQSGEQWAQCPPPPTWTPWLSTLVLHHGFPSGSVSVVQPVLVLSSNMKGNWHSFPLPGPSTVRQRSERKYSELDSPWDDDQTKWNKF